MSDHIAVPEIEYIEYQTGVDPQHSVIWLHGLGADGHDFEPIAPQLGLPADVPVRFIFPHAPERPITVNAGMVMRGWYDIVELPMDPERPRKEDRIGLDESAGIVETLIEQENRRGVPTQNIFLAGFSQGGAIALFAGLRMKTGLAGIIALSTYLPDADSFAAERSEENAGTPIFFAHGEQDPVIPLAAAVYSKDYLEKLGYRVEWHTYPMPHAVHPLEIQEIGEFMNAVLAR